MTLRNAAIGLSFVAPLAGATLLLSVYGGYTVSRLLFGLQSSASLSTFQVLAVSAFAVAANFTLRLTLPK